jgi:hypothetical protein
MAKVKVTRIKDRQTEKESAGCSCASGCCGGGAAEPNRDEPFITGTIQTSFENVPCISTKLSRADILGAWKVRWGIGRMSYTVKPRLYAVNAPNADSPVLVTANYKLSFDMLRRELNGLDAWILVLDTKGVNVWCAAGKGTFGTEELVRRIQAVKLSGVIHHKTLILPQLGATGVAAAEVLKRSGFRVFYGPVRAADITKFLNLNRKATPEMRTVEFPLVDRLVLTPVELVGAIKPLLFFFGALFILNALGLGNFGLPELIAFSGAVVLGTVLTPVLLPWIPGKAFSFKGALLGLLWAVAVNVCSGWPPHYGLIEAAALMLLLPSISAYLAMNFTGCSTYTSPTGVTKEMRLALPMMLLTSSAGVLLLIADMIIKILL